MQLRNAGTTWVESLDYYLLRLAHTVGITHGALLQICNAKAGGARFQLHGTSSPFLCNQAELQARIAVIEELTGQANRLRHGTFWVCSAAMGVHAFSAATRVRRWCPVCYARWEPDRSVEPLAWIIAVKRLCSLHECELVDRCRACGKAQPVRTSYRARRACRFCRASLGWEAASVALRQTPLDRWVEAQADEVIMLCADLAQNVLPEDRFRLFLKAYITTHGGRRDLPPALRSAVSLWAYGPSMRVSLRNLINLAAMHGCSVVDMLLDPVATAQRKPLFEPWQGFDHLPLISRTRVRGSVRLQVALRNLLRRMTVCYLPALSLVADNAGCEPADVSNVSDEVLAAYRQGRARHRRLPQSPALEEAIPAALHALDGLGFVHVKRCHLCKIVPGLATISGLALSDVWRVAETALVLRRAKRAREGPGAPLPDAVLSAFWLR